MGACEAVVWTVREEGAEYRSELDLDGDGLQETAGSVSAETGGASGSGTGGSTSAETGGQTSAETGGSTSAETGEPGPDPDSVASDAREARMDEVATLYGEITSATREFLAALAESDRHRDWAEEGFGSCAEWLAWRIGVTRNAANEKVRTAHALEHLPLISEAMTRGEISFTKARALTRAAKPDSESELLELARSVSAARLERVIRGWKLSDRHDEARQERIRHESRSFSVFPDAEGMYVVRGSLTPEAAALLMRAVEAASDALFRAENDRSRNGRSETDESESAPSESDRSRPASDPLPTPCQRRADALALLAERALAAGFGEEQAPVSGSRAERYQVLLHVERRALEEHAEPGLSELEDGTRVTAETARRLCCDASVVEVGKSADGRVLDIGRKTRTIPPALRRALAVRDRGCRFPGCGTRFTEAHHIVHWADGGETSLSNTVLTCKRHHRRVHEEGWKVYSDTDGRQVVFFTPKGKALFDAPRKGAEIADELRRADGDTLDASLAGTPSVGLEGTPSVDLEGTPSVDLEGTSSVDSAGTAAERAGTPSADPASTATEPVGAPSEGSATRSPTPAAALRARLAERGIAPDHASCGQKYRHDRFVPWHIEAAALDALDRADEVVETDDAVET